MRIIDLSLPVDNNMPGVKISISKTREKDGWNATTLELYSHAGTHMDAPRHFVPEGATLESQPLAICIGPARVVNLAATPRQLIGVEDVQSALTDMAPGSRLLLRTDWYKKYGQPIYRDGIPRISPELAHWLVDRKLGLLGVEPPSVADVNDLRKLEEVHQILFHGGVTIVEGLAYLDQINTSQVDFIALPLRIDGGDGCPVRAVAIDYDQEES